MASRVVFFDEDEGKISCRSQLCKWRGNFDYLYNHYKNNHSGELLASNDNVLRWSYDQNSNIKNKIYLAWISDTMFWLHEKITDEEVNIALQNTECGKFIYNVRVRTYSDKLIIGKMDMYKILPKKRDLYAIFEEDCFKIKIQILDKIIIEENKSPSFELTVIEGDSEIKNAIGKGYDVYVENDVYKYKCHNNLPYECLSYNKNEFKCIICESDEVHVSQLTMCDAGHSICPFCKEGIVRCPVDSCESEYSEENRNPVVAKALKLFGLEGMIIR